MAEHIDGKAARIRIETIRRRVKNLQGDSHAKGFIFKTLDDLISNVRGLEAAIETERQSDNDA